MNKACGRYGIPLELFQILKDDAVIALHSVCLQIWKTQQWPQDWKRSVFIPIPKKGNAKECSNYHTIAVISHASKVMLKILQVRLQQFVNPELSDVQAGFRNSRGTKDQIANIHWIIEKMRVPEKRLFLLFWLCQSLCVDHNKLENSERDGNTRPPDLPLEKSIRRTGHETTDWFQIGKGERQGCILSPCLFNFYAEYITRNAGLEEAQAGVKIAGRNISNLRYADDTTLMAESEEELKSLLMKWKWRVKKLA